MSQEFTYPSIDGPRFDVLDEPCIAFEKTDGSNLRFFWNVKRGWHSTGTRFKWFKPETPNFGQAVELFQTHYADGILAAMRPLKEYRGVNDLVAFCEFHGDTTFSGLHHENDAKRIVLFDIHIPGRGFIPPNDFVAHFGHLDIAKVLYEGPFSKTVIEDVRSGKYEVNEGVVAKGLRTTRKRKGKIEQEVWMAKVKTQRWLDELARRAGDSDDMKAELERNLAEQGVTPQ